jgi:Mg-chelatase subunit ChlD
LHVLVISDGAPNSQNQAFDSAKVLAAECIIDVLFVGSANDERCIEFMKKLAEIGRGRYQSLDLSGATALMLGSKVNDMLALPSPKGSIEL